VSDVESRASLSDVLDESEGARTAARAVREPAARGARVASSGDRPAAPPATDRNGACRMAIGPGPVRPPGWARPGGPPGDGGLRDRAPRPPRCAGFPRIHWN